jgi:hypothetical protein
MTKSLFWDFLRSRHFSVPTNNHGQTRMTKSAYSQKKVLLSFFTIFISLLSLSQAFAAEKKVVLLPLALYADPGKDYLRQGIRSMLASRLSGEGLQVVGRPYPGPFSSRGGREERRHLS